MVAREVVPACLEVFLLLEHARTPFDLSFQCKQLPDISIDDFFSLLPNVYSNTLRITLMEAYVGLVAKILLNITLRHLQTSNMIYNTHFLARLLRSIQYHKILYLISPY